MKTRQGDTMHRALQALTKPSYLLGLLLAVKLLVLRSLVFMTPDLPRFLITDLTAAVLVAAAVEGRRLGRRSTIILVDVVFSTLLGVLFVFHSFYGRLPSLQALGFAGQLGDVTESVGALLKPSLLLAYADIPVLALLAWFKPAFFERRLAPRVRGTFVLIATLVAAADIWLAVAQPLPDFTQAAEARGIVNQEVAEWMSREVIVREKTASASDPRVVQEQLDKLLAPGSAELRKSEVASASLDGAGKGRNVIVIISEALQEFAVQGSAGGQAITPNILELAKQGYRCDNIVTQVAAGNTSDAEFVVNTSLMPLENRPFALEYEGHAVPSMPRLLKAKGYRTMTFHPNDVTFWYRDKLYPALGFDEVYESKFYGKEDIVGIGDSDDVIFQKALPVLAKAAKSGKPFYAEFVTLSAHHPFNLPAAKRTMTLPPDQADTLTGRYVVSQHYADAAIGRFVEGLKKAGLYENTVIVVLGDHFGLQQSTMSPDDLRVASQVAGRTYGEIDRFKVPLIIAVPGAGRSKAVHTPGGQVDVLPTLATVMGVSLDGFVHVGRDLARPSAPSLAGMRYYAPAGTYVDDKVLAIPRGSGGVEVWSLETGKRLADVPRDMAEKSMRIRQVEQLSDDYLRTMPEQ